MSSNIIFILLLTYFTAFPKNILGSFLIASCDIALVDSRNIQVWKRTQDFPFRYSSPCTHEVQLSRDFGKSCFVVHDSVYPPWKQQTPIHHSKLDSWIHNRTNLILDFYRLRKKLRRTEGLNRHLMTVKILIESLNLSISACDPSDAADFDIKFGLTTVTKSDRKYSLIFSRETFQLKFLSPKRKNHNFTFSFLVAPIGERCLLATLISAVLIALTLTGMGAFASHKISVSKQNVVRYFFTLLNMLALSLIDQCISWRRVSKQLFTINLIYGLWLFYSVLVQSSYRSGFIRQLVKPPSSVWITTFKELSEDHSREVVGLGDGGRFGQAPNVTEILISEHKNSLDEQRKESLRKISDKFTKPRTIDFHKILRGKVNVLDDAFAMQVLHEAFVRQYGSSIYGLSTDFVNNFEFWAVKQGRYGKPVLEIIRKLVSGGITDHFKIQQEIQDLTVVSNFMRDYVFEHPLYSNGKNYMKFQSSELSTEPVPLKLSHVNVLLIALSFALAHGIIIFLIETVTVFIIDLYFVLSIIIKL
jgi:hypothetical protein